MTKWQLWVKTTHAQGWRLVELPERHTISTHLRSTMGFPLAAGVEYLMNECDDWVTLAAVPGIDPCVVRRDTIIEIKVLPS